MLKTVQYFGGNRGGDFKRRAYYLK